MDCSQTQRLLEMFITNCKSTSKKVQGTRQLYAKFFLTDKILWRYTKLVK